MNVANLLLMQLLTYLMLEKSGQLIEYSVKLEKLFD